MTHANAMKNVLIIGGTSGIGRAIANEYGRQQWNVMLAGRDIPLVERNAADLRTRHGVAVTSHFLDVLETGRFEAFLDDLPVVPDTAVCAVGALEDEQRCRGDAELAARVLRTNFEGPALLLEMLSRRLAERSRGTIVGISSVAGDRGRGSNYVYGSAKAGLTAYLSGLRNRLHPLGVRVVTVKPGFVRTRMTAGMRLPPPLTAEPVEVAKAVFRAAETRPADVIYVRAAWRVVMLVIRSIPERVFRKLKL
jgi:decaprenylphospho-beta-D-erythro-pentofuranosid-2-ulose 2-reductase